MPKLARSLLFSYLRPEWRRTAVLGVLLLAGIGLQLANPQIVKVFIDRAVAGASPAQLATTAVLFLVVAVLAQVATVAETYLAEDLGWRTTNALRADLTRHVLSLDGSFHAEHSSGELIERIDGDVSAIADFFARFVVQILGSGLFLVGVLVLLYAADWRVGAVLTVCSLVGVGFMIRGGGFVAGRAGAARQAAAALTGYLEESLGALPDLKANGADAYAMRRMNERLATRFHRAWRAAQGGSLFNGVIGVIFAAGTGAALALSIGLHAAGAMTIGTVFLVFRYAGMLQVPLGRLTYQMNRLQQALGGVVRVRGLLDTKPRVPDGSGVSLPAGRPTLQLEHVSFSYGELPVLDDVSFRLEAGEVLGLLGRTGSGKTTISRLLFRLHDPTRGKIRLNGIDIRNATLDDLRARIGLVTQDVQLLQGTLRDNVTMFDGTLPDRTLRDAFRALGLREWLAGLPAGLDTLLGTGGRGVSAGEAQLIALARLFLKDPGLVVLDEASSRLDPYTQALLEEGMSRLLLGRTAIVIAHRLETVQRADTILILEAGCITELGPRRQLGADPLSHYSRLLRAGMAEALA